MIPLKDNIPTVRFPVVTVALILINVLVFIAFQGPSLSFNGSGVDQGKVVRYGAIPYEITHPGKHCGESFRVAGTRRTFHTNAVACEGTTVHGFNGLGQPVSVRVTHVVGKQPSTWLTALSAMFMHGGLLHILGNMLFLWIFGNNVEDAMGRPKFILFYLLGGLAALAGQVLIDPNSTAPTIGASGAIAAVLGGYIILYPRARVVTLILIILFFTVVELPALVVLGLWFLQQIAFGALDLTNPTGSGGGVAYFAHIGGFAFGLLAIRAFARRARPIQPQIPVY